MNHKRKHAKLSRAGCLLCKPNKLGKGMEKKLGHRGFGNLRKSAVTKQDMNNATWDYVCSLRSIENNGAER